MMNLFTTLLACVSNRHFEHHLNAFKLISKGFKCVLSVLETFKSVSTFFLPTHSKHNVNRFFTFLEFWTVVYLHILPV
jgi:hypothetical protein